MINNAIIENNIKQLKSESISIKKFKVDIYNIDAKYDSKDVNYIISFVIVLNEHVFPLDINVTVPIDTIYEDLVKITTTKIEEKCNSFYKESFEVFNKIIGNYIGFKKEFGKQKAFEYLNLDNNELLSFYYIYNRLDNNSIAPEFTELYNLMKNKITLKGIEKIVDADLYDFEVAEYIPKYSNYKINNITVSIENDKVKLDITYDSLSPVLSTYIPVNYDDRDRYLFEYLDETLTSYTFHFFGNKKG